jgi:lipopolysaccharide transport system ATP-binding protein
MAAVSQESGMSELALHVRGISKMYQIGVSQARHDSLRDMVADRVKRFGRSSGRDQRQTTIWALRDVTFDVRRGEAIGLIGRNGAGKSTLLKILSRITEPTTGHAEVYGRVGSLLEVGTGFDRELTGRDNIYLSGAILGMRKAEIDAQFDEIVAFSELEQFLDTPVKRYSSGMYVRLAFAVAAHLQPEVLFVDEVLAVGDAAFQRKCLRKMRDVANQSRTIILVSHNMAAITRLCKYVVWIERGRVRDIGPAPDVVMQYLSLDQQDAAELKYGDDAPGSDYVRLRSLRLRDEQGHVTAAFRHRSSQTIEVEYDVLRPTASARIGFALTTHDGLEILTSRDADYQPEILERSPGTYVATCTIPAGFLRRGQYALSFGCDTPKIQTHFRLDRALVFRVEDVVQEGEEVDRGGGLVRLSLPWTLDRVL